jgi:galactose mutarotase-like enzyme
MEPVPYLGRTLRRWRVGPSTFLALPELGARLMNWNLTVGDGSVRDIVHWPEIDSLEDFAKVRGGNPILFPFSARTFDRGEIHWWRDPAGVRRPMPMHGIARQADFELTAIDARGFTARLVPGEEARAAYPFDYEFTVTYRFGPDGLACEFALRNLGAAPLPWSAGHHFYFKVPWAEEGSRAATLIRLAAGRRLRQDAAGRLVPGPELGPVESLGNPALLDTIHTNLRSGEAMFGEEGRPGDVILRIGTGPKPPPEAAFVTWTLAEDSPFYCVEPWMGPPNAPETGVGLHLVPPGDVQTFTVSVRVK